MLQGITHKSKKFKKGLWGIRQRLLYSKVQTMKTAAFIKRSTFGFVLAFCAFAIPSSAQHYIGLYANGAAPMNQLNDSGYRNGAGFSVEYLSPSLFSQTPSAFEFRLGAGIEFLHHGNSKKVKDLVFNTPNNDKGSVKLQNLMFGFYVAPKFIFNTGNFSPYFDVMANFRVFNTYQINRFNKEVQGYERESSSPIIQNGVAHYGGSVGLLYRLHSTICFDARVSYTTGTAIKFADLGSITKDPAFESNVSYRTVKSPVSDVLVFRLGILFTITPNSQQTYDNDSRPLNLTPNTPNRRPAEVKPMPKPTPPVNH